MPEAWSAIHFNLFVAVFCMIKGQLDQVGGISIFHKEVNYCTNRFCLSFSLLRNRLRLLYNHSKVMFYMQSLSTSVEQNKQTSHATKWKTLH